MPFMLRRMPEPCADYEGIVERDCRERGPFIVDVTVHAHSSAGRVSVVFERIAELTAGKRDLWRERA